MLSGQGIDGELKSKFGELTENFWKSSSWGNPIQAKNFQAIYFANGERSGGGGEKKLEDLKGDDNKALVQMKNGGGKEVQSAFGICVGSQNENGCRKDNNNASVVLVGSDDLDNAMTWERLKEQNWGQTSLVRSGYKYQNLFNKNIWKGKNEAKGVSLNGNHLQRFLNKHRQKDQMKKVLCPWYPSTGNQSVNQACHGAGLGRKGNGTSRLNDFLRSDSAQKFFDGSNWKDYGSGWKYVALLSLVDMWSTSLTQINFASTDDIFKHNEEGFKLAPFMGDKGKILYLQQSSAGGENDLSKITYHSGGTWRVRLCSDKKGCSNDNGLNLTVGDGKFCVVKDVCFSGNDSHNSISDAREKWASLQWSQQAGGLWTTIIGSKSGAKLVRDLFISLVAVSFENIKNVSLSINANLEKGEMLLKKLN